MPQHLPLSQLAFSVQSLFVEQAPPGAERHWPPSQSSSQQSDAYRHAWPGLPHGLQVWESDQHTSPLQQFWPVAQLASAAPQHFPAWQPPPQQSLPAVQLQPLGWHEAERHWPAALHVGSMIEPVQQSCAVAQCSPMGAQAHLPPRHTEPGQQSRSPLQVAPSAAHVQTPPWQRVLSQQSASEAQV